VFVGNGTTTLRFGRESVSSKPTPLRIALLRPKQVVVVRFLSSYKDSLRLFGLRAVDNAVRARVLEVARRDYAGINIEFREASEDMPGLPRLCVTTRRSISAGLIPMGLAISGTTIRRVEICKIGGCMTESVASTRSRRTTAPRDMAGCLRNSSSGFRTIRGQRHCDQVCAR
jgi:hypothetical protein